MTALAALLTLGPLSLPHLARDLTSPAALALGEVVASPSVLVGALLWLILVIPWDAALPVPAPRPPVTPPARPGTVRGAGAGRRCR
jgi:hypothetical protein